MHALTTFQADTPLDGQVRPSLAVASAAADQAAGRRTFDDYRSRLAANTRRRQDGDLALFAQFLATVRVTTGDLASEPSAWAGITWGLVQAFVAWMLREGYSIGSINVRLATVKAYAKHAARAGALTPQAYALIRTVAGYRHSEGRNVDAQRKQTRVGDKKAEPVTITPEQAAQLKAQPPETPQGRRDALLMCLLLDHGLRVGEIAALPANCIDLKRGRITFYREKVDKLQTHKLTADTFRAASDYLARDAPAAGTLLRGSRKNGTLNGPMGARNITRRVRVLGEALGISGLSAHDCRHYWATRAMERGTDVKTLQEAGGWNSPAMPLRYAAAAEIANDGVKL
jgi:integrase